MLQCTGPHSKHTDRTTILAATPATWISLLLNAPPDSCRCFAAASSSVDTMRRARHARSMWTPHAAPLFLRACLLAQFTWMQRTPLYLAERLAERMEEGIGPLQQLPECPIEASPT